MAVPDKSLEFVRLGEEDQFGTQRDIGVGRERMEIERAATPDRKKAPPELLKLTSESPGAVELQSRATGKVRAISTRDWAGSRQEPAEIAISEIEG